MSINTITSIDEFMSQLYLWLSQLKAGDEALVCRRLDTQTKFSTIWDGRGEVYVVEKVSTKRIWVNGKQFHKASGMNVVGVNGAGTEQLYPKNTDFVCLSEAYQKVYQYSQRTFWHGVSLEKLEAIERILGDV